MANLFPIGSLETITLKENKQIEFKGSYAVNFETGKFIKNLDGTIKILDAFEGYIQWCYLAMMTARYKYRAYSSKFGKDVIGSVPDNKAMELELKRVTQEALMVHPMTESVDNFSFDWRNGEVYYEYEVQTVKGQKKVLTSTEKVG